MEFEFIEDEGLRAKAVESYKATKAADEQKWNEILTTRITEATTGLQSKNAELLAEKKKIQERFKDIKDPQEALQALQLINENEDMQLIKNGKIDEVVERRLGTVRSDYEAKLAELGSTLENEKKTGGQYKNLFHNKMVEDTIRDAALVAKIRPEALHDVVMRGKQVFSLGEDNKTVEARDHAGKLIKIDDGTKILTPSLFIETLKKDAPHFWPQSESAKFDQAGATELDDIERAMNAAADRGDSKEYRRLRDKFLKAQGK